jgi:enterochelin esterase family protein
MRDGSDADKAPEWMARAVASKPRLPIDIWMEVGAYESAGSNAIGMMPTNRRLRDLLLSKGYSVEYSEFAGGHEYINWRASLGDALVHVFAPDAGARRR